MSYFNFRDGATLCKPYIAFYGGWWDMVALVVCNRAKLYSSAAMPESFINDAFTVVVLIFILRSMYALVQYFPYGKKGKTVWYPLAEAIAILLIVNGVGSIVSRIDLNIVGELTRGVLFVAVIRVVLSVFVFGQNVINGVAGFFHSEFKMKG